jgi:hypothetical protein
MMPPKQEAGRQAATRATIAMHTCMRTKEPFVQTHKTMWTNAGVAKTVAAVREHSSKRVNYFVQR